MLSYTSTWFLYLLLLIVLTVSIPNSRAYQPSYSSSSIDIAINIKTDDVDYNNNDNNNNYPLQSISDDNASDNDMSLNFFGDAVTSMQDGFRSWMKKFNKDFSLGEFVTRMKNWWNNLSLVVELG